MTVNYHKDIMTARPWTFLRLLFSWKASIWKAVYIDVIVYLVIYYTISIVYRTALNKEQQSTFERVVRYFDNRISYIPLELVLGFFCTQMFNRWTKLYQSIGFIDNVGLMTALYVRGTDEKARQYRRNILRYCELTQVLVFRDISMRTRRRFPTLDTVVAAGFMMEHEKEVFDTYNDNGRSPKYWIPANWALAMTYKARKEGYIESDYYKMTVQKQIQTWRTDLEWLCNYDWVPYPLIYPQVVWLAVHLHFLVTILSRQFIVEGNGKKSDIDLYFPFMTILQFIFYMGWMKVIEVVLNPFGEDDDDYETNALIDRNITMGMMIVDRGYNRPPELKKDPFWDEIHPLYSEATAKIPIHPQVGSVSHIKLASDKEEVIMVPHANEHEDVVPSNSRRSIVRVKKEDRYVPPPKKETSFLQTLFNPFRRFSAYFSSLVKRICCSIRSRKVYDVQNPSPLPSATSDTAFVRSVPRSTTEPAPMISPFREKAI